MSTTFVSRTIGITPILKYRRANPIVMWRDVCSRDTQKHPPPKKKQATSGAKVIWVSTLCYHFFFLFVQQIVYLIFLRDITKEVKLANLIESGPKVLFLIATTPQCRRRRYSIPKITPLQHWSSPIELNAKPGGIKYHFLSLWYDLTLDWALVSSDHWWTLFSLANGTI